MAPYSNDQEFNEAIGLLGRIVASDDGNDNNSPPVRVPLVGVSVQAEVLDFVAEVTLSQCYKNTEANPIEATYHFPVDEAAAVCRFQAEYEDGTVVKGVVKEKGQAKKEYNQAISQGKQANLLEMVRRDVFTLCVGNLPPGGFVKITLTYITSLKAQDDAAAFIVPTCIAPRYTPLEDNVSVAEAQALSPPVSDVKMFGLDISVVFTCRSNIKTITCPTQESEPNLLCEFQGKTGRLSLSNISMDRELVVLVVEEKCHQPRAIIERSKDGTLAGFVTLFPQIEFPDLPREFVFLIDRSGSMSGNKMQQTRDTLLLFLRALPVSCTFNIVGFGCNFASLFNKSMPYNDETLDRASQYAMAMQADFGGTEIKAPLEHIFRQRWIRSSVDRQVFVLTDGQVSNDLQVFDVIRRHCASKNSHCRLFSVGLGAGVSRHLVEGMARAGRGTARFVEDGNSDSLRVKVLGQLKQALQPSLDDVNIEWKFPAAESKKTPEIKPTVVKTLLGYRSPSVDEPTSPAIEPKIFPSVIPPVFNQEKFLSFALFAGGSDVPESVKITCDTIDGPLEVLLPISHDDIFEGSVARKMAARTAISEFEDNRKSRPGRSNIEGTVISESEALQLALTNDLASEQTSFIAILESPVVEAGTEQTKKVIPQFLSEPIHLSGLPAQERFRSGELAAMLANAELAAMLANAERCNTLGGAGSWDLSELQCSQNVYKKAKGSAKGSAFGFGFGDIFDSVKSLGRSTRQAFAKAAPPVTSKPPTTSPNVPSDQFMDPKQGPPSHSQAASSSDKLLKLCVLQKADGSFLLDERLAQAVGVTEGVLQSMASQTRTPSNKAVVGQDIFATALTVAVMRVQFTAQEDVWKLQEGKALKFLASKGLTRSEIDGILSELEVQMKSQLAK